MGLHVSNKIIILTPHHTLRQGPWGPRYAMGMKYEMKGPWALGGAD